MSTPAELPAAPSLVEWFVRKFGQALDLGDAELGDALAVVAEKCLQPEDLAEVLRRTE